jgi:predicted TIM-barrel fold metal-dependent hydrolase
MEFTVEQLEFIERARQTINPISRSRASQVVKDTLDENNYVFDAHCHIFDGDCINVKYMAVRMLAGAVGRFRKWIWKLVTGDELSEEMSLLSDADLIDYIYNAQHFLREEDLNTALSRMEKELDSMEQKSADEENLAFTGAREFIKRYRFIIWLLRTGRMEDVYIAFKEKYAIHNVVNSQFDKNYKLLIVALGMDLNSGWDNTIPKTWEEQNAELSEVSKVHPILPFFPIDPRRVNLYDAFLDAFSSQAPKFYGVKCYPALGYLPSDYRLMPIFKICEEMNIPVMTHCGGEVVSTFANPILVNRLNTPVVISDNSRKLRARRLNEPLEWDIVLNEFPGLRLCLGHYGGAAAWENKPDTLHRLNEIFVMMGKYKNLYADFSFNLESLTAIKNFKSKLYSETPAGSLMRERSMFGTDFWVVLPLSDLNQDQLNFVSETQSLLTDLLKTNVLKYLNL